MFLVFNNTISSRFLGQIKQAPQKNKKIIVFSKVIYFHDNNINCIAWEFFFSLNQIYAYGFQHVISSTIIRWKFAYIKTILGAVSTHANIYILVSFSSRCATLHLYLFVHLKYCVLHRTRVEGECPFYRGNVIFSISQI